MQQFPDRFSVVIFFFVVFAVILFWLVLPARFLANESSDFSSFYSPVASNFLAGKGFTTDNDQVALRYPLGYPLVLAAFYALANSLPINHQQSIQILTLLSMSFSAVVVYWLAKEIWPKPWALLAPLAWGTFPLLLWLTKQPNSEIPFLIFLYTAVYTFWLGLTRSRHVSLYFLTSGLLLGFGMLIRPFAVGLPFIMIIFLWFCSRASGWKVRLQWVILLLAGVLVFVLPWEIWLTQQTDRFYLLSSGAFPSVRDGLTFAVNEKGYRQPIHVPQDVELLMTDILALSQSGEIRSLSDVVTYLAAELGTRPLAVSKLMAIKAARSWYATDSGRYELPGLLLQIFYAVPLVWGSLVAWKQKGSMRLMTVFIWLLVGYAWLMTTAVLSIYRYLLPTASLLFIFLPGFFMSLGHYFRKEQRRTATP